MSANPPPTVRAPMGAEVRYVVCETVTAITPHARAIGNEPHNYGGGLKTRALCGAKVSWDTHLPLTAVRCRDCLRVLEEAAK